MRHRTKARQLAGLSGVRINDHVEGCGHIEKINGKGDWAGEQIPPPTMIPEWKKRWGEGQLAERLMLVGEDVALEWAVQDDQLEYVALVFNRQPAWIARMRANRIAWAGYCKLRDKSNPGKPSTMAVNNGAQKPVDIYCT